VQVAHLVVEHRQRGRRMLDKQPQQLPALPQRFLGLGVGGSHAERLNAELDVSRQFRQQITSPSENASAPANRW
jgi:hypothetical protein